MRKITLAATLGILLVLPSLTAAVTLDSLSATADCNAWSADLTINFRMFAMMARVEYTVVLQNANGVELERFDFAEFIDIPETDTASYNFTEVWNTPLDGSYTVTGDFVVFDIFSDGYNMTTDTFTAAMDCGESAPSAACFYPPRYWAARPDQWPVTSLYVAGRTMDQTELLDTLTQPAGRPLVLLVRELIAARLNLALIGSEDVPLLVDKTELFLTQRPLDRRRAGQFVRQANMLRMALRRYNRQGCADDVPTDMTRNLGQDANKVAVEVLNLGTVKAMYR